MGVITAVLTLVIIPDKNGFFAEFWFCIGFPDIVGNLNYRGNPDPGAYCSEKYI